MTMKTAAFFIKSALVFASLGASSAFGEAIEMVGSSTVYPFATVAAERFGRGGDFASPRVEATGTGGGFKLFCAGMQAPDIANASRRVKQSELDLCAQNGVGGMIEIPIGFDGIVIARAADSPSFSLSRRDIFAALAREIPDGGNLIANPHKKWRDVNPALPDLPIRVYGPPPTSGTRDAFAELAMEGGCQTYPALAAMRNGGDNKSRYRAVCHSLREDGAYIEVGENDNLIVQKLLAAPDSLGVFGYSFLSENLDKVRGAKIDGVAPDFDAIADSTYPISRPLFLYIKKARLDKTPGLGEFMDFIASESAIGEDGFLAERGLVPLAGDALRALRERIRRREVLEKL